MVSHSANLSGIRLNRRGRLARTFVVLSLAVVLGSLVSAKAGAGTDTAAPTAHSFITVTVAPGETIWALAHRVAGGNDVRSLIAEIVQGLSEGLADGGLQLLAGASGFSAQKEEALVRTFLSRRVEAIYLSGSSRTPATRSLACRRGGAT